MSYDYIIMKTITSLHQNDTPVRTQITLTKRIKKLLEENARKQNESLAEYLRKAALLRWLVEHDEQKHRERIAELAVGSIDLRKHPVWRSKKAVYNWSRKIRQQW